MMNISLGQYFPAESPIHHLDPRIKVIGGILYIVCAFLCRGVAAFGVLLLSAVLLILISRIPFRIVLGGIRPILFIMLFTMIINLFLTTGETALWEFRWSFIHLTIYKEGIYNAVFMMIRIVMLILGTSIFMTYTTTPIALTDGIELLLSPLKKIRVPVHEFAMMMTITLRFIPTLIEETEKIIRAQKARGTDFESGGLIKRAKAMIPILVPLFVSSFRRADELATSMECRCYHGGNGRTRMRILKLRFADFFAVFLLILLGTGIVLCNLYAPGYVM
jgi:energy-coupling factor transport system permease protein